MSSSNDINGGFKKTSRFWPCLQHIMTCVSVAFYYCIIQKSAFRGVLWKSCPENFWQLWLWLERAAERLLWLFYLSNIKFSYKDKTNEIEKNLWGTSSNKGLNFIIIRFYHNGLRRNIALPVSVASMLVTSNCLRNFIYFPLSKCVLTCTSWIRTSKIILGLIFHFFFFVFSLKVFSFCFYMYKSIWSLLIWIMVTKIKILFQYFNSFGMFTLLWLTVFY